MNNIIALADNAVDHMDSLYDEPNFLRFVARLLGTVLILSAVMLAVPGVIIVGMYLLG